MSERTLTLEEIKQVELDILKYLHDLCEQHQIKYFIDFGRYTISTADTNSSGTKGRVTTPTSRPRYFDNKTERKTTAIRLLQAIVFCVFVRFVGTRKSS